MKTMHVVLALAILAVGALVSTDCFAMRLLTKEEALKQVFPEAQSIVNNTRLMTVDEVEKIKARLGGQLVHYQEGSKSEKMEAQPGKWGPVEFCIALDMKTAKVKNLAVMSYEEKRGRPIARNNFLNQFIGKGSQDPLTVRKDIRAISGATISSDCTCFAVRKAIAVYEELFLDKNVKERAISKVSQ